MLKKLTHIFLLALLSINLTAFAGLGDHGPTKHRVSLKTKKGTAVTTKKGKPVYMKKKTSSHK